MANVSFGLLKPDCLKRNLVDEVFSMIELQGFKIIAQKQVRLKKEHVDLIWKPCIGQWFYNEMIEFSTSSDCIVFLAEGDDAINRLNDLVGHYDPEKACEGTIRRKYGISCMENIIHSSTDETTYKEETTLFFQE